MGSDTEWSKVRRGKERRVGVRKFNFTIRGADDVSSSKFNWHMDKDMMQKKPYHKNWAEYACKVGKCSGVDIGDENGDKKE